MYSDAFWVPMLRYVFWRVNEIMCMCYNHKTYGRCNFKRSQNNEVNELNKVG